MQRWWEGIQSGALFWYLPHSIYPDGYHCDPEQPLPFAGIASQKNHIGLYLFCTYNSPGEHERFRKEWIASGHRLDMGKSCVRFRKLENVPLDVIGRVFKRITAKQFVASYEAGLPKSAAKRSTTARKATKAAPKKVKRKARKRKAK